MKYLRFLLVALVLLGAYFLGQHINLYPNSADEAARGTGNHQDRAIPRLVSATDFTSAWNKAEKGSTAQTELIKRATLRRDRFLKLMADEPSEAIKRAISLAEYAALPEAMRPYFEQPLNTSGSIDLLWATSEVPDQGRECHHHNTVTIQGEKLRAYPAGRHMLPVMHEVPISGIRLGGVAVIGSSPVRKIPESERTAAKALFAAAELTSDPLTNRPVDGKHVALIAGKVYQFESAATLAYVEQTLLESIDQAEKNRVAVVKHPFEWLAGNTGGDSGEGVDATPYQEEQIDVLFIRVDFSDFPVSPVYKPDLESTLNTVDGHLNNYSYGQAGITYTVSDSVYRMPRTGASYATAGDNDGIQTDARALAAADYTIADYDVIAVFFPNLGGVSGSKITYGGLASIGGANHWVNGYNNVGIILHEFGHNYGLYHANYYHPEQELGGTYQLPDSLEYGDIFDEMGSGDSPQAHFSHLAKNYMQWMPDSKVVEATGDATYTIYRFDDVNATSNPLLAVKVPMSGDVNYWIGYRQLFTSASYNLENAAYVVAENLAQNRETSLIDMTPESAASETDDRKDAGLPVGGTYYDSDAGVRFNALERGGTNPNQWIKVQVVFDPRIALSQSEISIDEQCGVAHVVVQRSFSSTGAVSVDYSTSDGTASSGSDYYPVSGTLNWADGDSSDKTIIIPICPDVVSEGLETLTLTLSNISGGVLDPALSQATINLLDAGQRITSFAPPFFNVTVRAIAPLDDGRVVVGGDIYSVSGFPDINNIFRLHADGSVDTTFVTGIGFDDTVETIVVQTDGKYLVGGSFTSYNGTSCKRLIRLNADGSVDNTFLTNVGTAADDVVRSIAIENDGKILVGGSFDNFKGVTANGLVRLNDNGTPATALANPFSGSATIYDILAEPDGKIMVVGSFNLGWMGSGFRSGVARLTSSGARDTSFDAGAGAHADGNRNSLRPVYAVSRQADGKYIIGGWFTAYDESAANYCARINSNGSIDGTFTAPGFDNTVQDVIAQANGKTAVGGWFTSPAGRLERLTASGVADSTFMQGTGPSGSVYELATDNDGSLWVGGNFYSYNGSSCRPVIRIAGGETPYDIWAKTRFSAAEFANGDADPDADPDGDGMINLVEMAMGTNPLVANSDPVFAIPANGGVTLQNIAGQNYLQITLDKASLEKGAWFLAQFSSDLVAWSPVSPSPAANATYEVIEDSATTFTVRDKTPVSTLAPRFGRILIKQPE
ncbi:MAG: hypothetical protein H7A51_02820 [Akkermansiaceae bacterium]|nr:hypothetical protein [Akkermansiaceae bacterium]